MKYSSPVALPVNTRTLNHDKPIVIYALSLLGISLYHVLKNSGVVIDAICDDLYCDRIYDTIPIVKTSMLRDSFPKANIVIGAKYYLDIKKRLLSLGYEACDIYNASDFLCDCEIDISDISEDVWDFLPHYPKANEAIKRNIDMYFYALAKIFSAERLYLPSLDVVVTEKCSLKCKDCSNLMQYYQNPKDVDYNVLCKSIENTLSNIDYACEIRVLGGEPLLYKRLADIVERISMFDNVGGILVLTNGTIVPNPEVIKALNVYNVTVNISDYGEISRKASVLFETLTNNGVNTTMRRMDTWQDCGRFICGNDGTDALVDKYNQCCAQDMLTLLHGKLYRCPYSANAQNLGALPYELTECLPVCSENVTKKDIREFFYNNSFTTACTYCTGRGFDTPAIIPAIQTDKSLPYTQYNL